MARNNCPLVTFRWRENKIDIRCWFFFFFFPSFLVGLGGPWSLMQVMENRVDLLPFYTRETEMVITWQRKTANWTSPKQHGLEEKFVPEASRAERYCITVSLHVKWQLTSNNKGFSFSILILECIRLLFLKLLENYFLLVVKLIVSMYFKHNRRQCLFRNVFFHYLDSLLDTLIEHSSSSLWHHTN